MRIRCPTTSAVSTASTTSRSVARKARERDHRKRQREQQARMRAGADVFQGHEQDEEYLATRRVRNENASNYAYGTRRTTPTKQELREARARRMREAAAARNAEDSSSPLKRGLQYIYNNFIPNFGFSGAPNDADDEPAAPETPTRRPRKTYATPGAFPGLSLDSDSEEPSSPIADPDIEMADDTSIPSSSGTATGTSSDSASFSSSSPSSSSGNRSSFYAFPSSSATSTEDLFSSRTHTCNSAGCAGGYFYSDPLNSFRIFHDCHAKKDEDCMADEVEREKQMREEREAREAERLRKHAEKEKRERERERARRKEEERLRRENEEREYVRRQQERERRRQQTMGGREDDPFVTTEEDPRVGKRGDRLHSESSKPHGQQSKWWKTYKEEMQRARERDEKLRKEREERESLKKEEFERKKREREEQTSKAKEGSGTKQPYEPKWKARYAQARAHPYARGAKTARTRGGLRSTPADPFEFPAAGTSTFARKYAKPAFPGSSATTSGPGSKSRSSTDSVHSRKKYSKDPPVYFEWYEATWSEINTQRITSSLSFSEIPWAIVPFPRSLEEVTTARVKAFVRAKHSGSAGLRRVTVKERRAAAKKELLNWHSDKFATRVLERVADPAEREAVSRAADVVQKALTEYMREPDAGAD